MKFPRIGRDVRVAAGVAALVLVTYAWTLATSQGHLSPIHGRLNDYFNLLAHGFLKGHLYLDRRVPPELLQLSNPYDPGLRPQGLALHDTSLYHGRYYMYWGPIPALLLEVPCIVLTGQDLPIDYAVLIAVSLGFLVSVAICLWLRRRLYPEAGMAALAACVLVLGLANFGLILLRRHSWYELPIASGCAFCLLALYCVLRSLESPAAWRWAAAAGAAVGLAIGCRPVYVVAGLLLVLPWICRRWSLRAVAAAAATSALLVAGLLAYNFARFHRPLEFGVRYQLSGAIESQVRHFSASYVPFNAYVYFLAPLHWGRYFPFVHPIAAPPYPAGYGGSDSTYGIFANLPFAWLAIAAVVALIRRPRLEGWLLAVLAFALTLFLLFFVGAVGRYMGDFGPPFLLLACAGALAIDAEIRRRGARAVWIGALYLGAVVSSAVGVLTSFTAYDIFAGNRPRIYAALSRRSDAVVAALERWAGGPVAGPLDLRLQLPAQPAGSRTTVLTTGWKPNQDALVAEYLPGDRVHLGFFQQSGDPVGWSPSYPLGSGGLHTLHLDMGSLYPPPDHPYFRHVDPAERSWLKGSLRLVFDREAPWEIRGSFFDSSPGALHAGPAVASLRRGPADLTANRPPAIRHYEAELVLSPDWYGRSLPLITSGRTRAGDALLLRVDSRGLVRLGYDHWNSTLLESDPIAWKPGQRRRITFDAPGSAEVLTVALDGRVVWAVRAKSYAAPLDADFPGLNAIGATSCERAFPGADFRPVPSATAPGQTTERLAGSAGDLPPALPTRPVPGSSSP